MMNFDIIISMSSSFGIIRKVMKEDFVIASLSFINCNYWGQKLKLGSKSFKKMNEMWFKITNLKPTEI